MISKFLVIIGLFIAIMSVNFNVMMGTQIALIGITLILSVIAFRILSNMDNRNR